MTYPPRKKTRAVPQNQQKRRWVAPAVRRMAAGSAEDATQNSADAGQGS